MAGTITVILGSSVLVALTTLVGNIIMFRLDRKAKKEDKNNSLETKVDELSKKVDNVLVEVDEIKTLSTNRTKMFSEGIGNLKDGMMLLLKKEIEREASTYIEDGYITIASKEEIHQMHAVYHEKLGGNGGLNSIMTSVDGLKVVKS